MLDKPIIIVIMIMGSSGGAHWLSGRVFAYGLEDWSSISSRFILKTQKVVLDTSLLNTQHKVHFKGNVEQSRERSSALSYTSV